jgi:hypothetical protein
MRKANDMASTDNFDPLLASPFDALRSEMARLDAPRCVEKELMQAFAQQFPRKPRWYSKLATPGWSIASSLASAALVLLVFVLSPQAPHLRGGDRPLVGMGDGRAFIALESLERIEAEPSPRMVETQVPRTSLASLGLPVTPENAGDSVKAEMLVAADGEPLALRLTSIN